MTQMPLLQEPTQRPAEAGPWAGVAPQIAVSPPAIGRRRRVAEAVSAHLVHTNPEIRRLRASSSLEKTTGLVDVLFHQEDEPHFPDEVFNQLRWGGLFVYASRDPERVRSEE